VGADRISHGQRKAGGTNRTLCGLLNRIKEESMRNHATIKTDMINDLREHRELDEFNFDPLSTLDVAMFHVAIFGSDYFGTRWERDGVRLNYSKALKIVEKGMKQLNCAKRSKQ
jgi:hypothetical protein